MLKLHWWTAGAVLGLAAAAPSAVLADPSSPTPGPAPAAPPGGTQGASAATAPAIAANSSTAAATTDTAQAIPDDVPPAVRAYLEALQKRIKDLEDKLNQKEHPSDTPPGAIPAPGAPPPLPPVPSARTLTAPLGSRLQIGGYAQARITNISDFQGDKLPGHENVDLQVPYFRPYFTYYMDQHWESDLQLWAGTRSTGNVATSLSALDAYTEYHNGLNNEIALRFGQQKLPVGYEGWVEGDTDRAGLERARYYPFLDPLGRDIGLNFIWNPTKLPLVQAYNRGPLLTVGVFNGNGVDRFDNDADKDIAAEVRIPLGGHNSIGFSGLTGDFTPKLPGPTWVREFGIFDWESYWGKFKTQLELMDGRNLGQNITGGYGQGDYFFGAPGHAFIRYDWYDPAVGSTNEYWDRVSIGWFKDVTKNVRLTVEYDQVTNQTDKINTHPDTYGFQVQTNF